MPVDATGFPWGRRGTVSEVVERVHPAEPHRCPSAVGTLPSARGARHGRASMNSRLERCDREHVSACLESGKQENVPYYQRFGLGVTDEIVLPGGGPALWTMGRAAR
ncbi:hypothetical protein [Rhodococcus tukisamuensis]|uniref:Acetyltransferase (GNAT) family protein n=1 Tax=Rhodococcus tukisamuensis TaxID=168276 RepID=A0A1G7A2R8_9NOCA|nr:hypothetical protein [Rhodococcus tukisamuensis]SDE09228.1 hypothetical protein SAMN05444580_11019 [Rhodococcus tukisamuensis]